MAKIHKDIGGDNFMQVKEEIRRPEGGANSTRPRQSHTS